MNFNFRYILLLSIFLLLQIIWFNHIKLFGFITPVIFLYPFLIISPWNNENLQLLLAFFSGLFLDFIIQTGGIFTAVTVFIVYTKKIFFWYLDKPGKKPIENILKMEFLIKITYYALYIFIGILLISFLQSFQISFVISRIPYILLNTIFSLFFIVFIEYLFLIRTDK